MQSTCQRPAGGRVACRKSLVCWLFHRWRSAAHCGIARRVLHFLQEPGGVLVSPTRVGNSVLLRSKEHDAHVHHVRPRQPRAEKIARFIKE